MLARLPKICFDFWKREIQIQNNQISKNLLHSYSMNEAYVLLDANSTDLGITSNDAGQLLYEHDFDEDSKLNKTEFLDTFR